MCDFLSANICRDGRIVADGVHGHTELASRYIAGENGIGHRRFWEWELAPVRWREGLDAMVPMRIGDVTEVPYAVASASRSLLAELRSLNGVSKILPWLAVLQEGETEHLPSEVRTIVLCGSAKLAVLDGAQTVTCMLDSSQVGEMLDSSQVGKMLDSSQVGEMWGSSRVGEMWGSSRVGTKARCRQLMDWRG
ncbi:MAG: hypothetical protein ACYSVY_15760 [Planctomycetota bacterium]|jgi:hypothetical protein